MDIYIKIIITLIIITLGHYTCERNGAKYYYKKRSHNFDLLHKYIDENTNKKLDIVNNSFILSVVVYVIYNRPKLATDIITTFCNLMLLRALAINITIPPKHKTCDIKNTFNSYIFGKCYEKYISGHFALMFIATLFGYESGLFNNSTMFILNLINGVLIIVQRHHYSIDILFAIIASIFVKQNPFPFS